MEDGSIVKENCRCICKITSIFEQTKFVGVSRLFFRLEV